jgi:hypothetical protein
MLSRFKSVGSHKLLTAALAASLAVGCATDADKPSTGDAAADDEGSSDTSTLDDTPQLESAGCVNDAACPPSWVCFKPVFAANYCAQLCTFDPLGHSTCPPNFECTRPFPWTGRYRCMPD